MLVLIRNKLFEKIMVGNSKRYGGETKIIYTRIKKSVGSQFSSNPSFVIGPSPNNPDK